MKKFLLILFAFSAISAPLHAKEIPAVDMKDIYEEQLELSGANELKDALPGETKKSLDRLNLDIANWESISSLTPETIFSEVISLTKEQIPGPFRALAAVLAVMLLCAILNTMQLSFSGGQISSAIGLVSTLCVCISVILPVVGCICAAAKIITNAANFMLCYVPVMAGIMVASGQAASAVSYHMMMVSVGEAIAQVAGKFFVPILNIFLALSIVSTLSRTLNISGLCETFHTVVKWLLGLFMSIFVSLLTLQGIIGTAVDNAGIRTVKFAINSFVPIVGGALSDAFSTVQGCVKLLKSGVGAFGIIALGITFLPVVLQCLVWLFTIHSCAAVGDIFELKQVSSLLRACQKVVSTMLAIVLCCITILTVSTVLVLMMGGGAG